MAICKFYEQGNCRFGSNCRNEHIDHNQPRNQNQSRAPSGGRGGFTQNQPSFTQNQGRSGGFGSNQGQNQIRGGFSSGANQRGGFGSNQPRGGQNSNYNQRGQNTYQNRGGFHTDRGGRGRGNSRGGRHQRSDLEYVFGKDELNLVRHEIETDLTVDRPSWPLSAYGPGKNAPRQLIEGDLEVSMEEMRVHAYLAALQGEQAQLSQIEATAATAMEEVVQKIKNDIDGAIEFIIEGKNEHPNRYDVLKENSQGERESRTGRGGRGGRGGIFAVRAGGQQRQNAFSSTPANTGFAQAPTPGFGHQSIAQPAFGQPGQTAFGQSLFPQQQSSSFGQINGSGFGQQQNGFQSSQPMQQDQMNMNPFGTPQSIQHASNAFGQPNQITNSPFGQAQPANGGFGVMSVQTADLNGDRAMVDDPPAGMFGLNEQLYQDTYQQAMQNGGFQGIVPMVAPKKEWMS